MPGDNKTHAPEADLLTVREVAKRLRCCERTAWTLVDSGELPSFRINRLIRVSVGDLESYLRQNRRDTQAA
jgi:excisionase family DNA binding protein